MGVRKRSVLFIVLAVLLECRGQEYDFGAEISRQCLVPDPVGLLDCVENKVTLPYLTSWVDCTNSLGQNVKTSADIINYRCKSVWEGKGVIPEVFYIKDCVIEKTGLPAKNVSAEVLGAYKECEATPDSASQQIQQGPLSQTRIKTAPIPKKLVYTPIQQLQINEPAQQQKIKVPIQQQQVSAPTQEYDFAAEMTRQCLVPDPVGLLDCVENKVTLPYLRSWVDCTNSLGQNVKTSSDIINYRCKSVWEGKGLIPEVFYIKDCVIAKTGLPAKNVSAEVLGAYKECEAIPNSSARKIQLSPLSPATIKTTQIQQQIRMSVPQQQVDAPTQEYDFGAEISRQCLVPDPVGLLDCVENKVTLPYLTSWVDCTNSLGQNVKTSADIINYRCKSVWEGKGVIPEVFYIKDCVIAKTGLPAKTVSAEVLGAYKECESSRTYPSQLSQQTPISQITIKTSPIQQQQIYSPVQQQQMPAPIQQQKINAPIQQQSKGAQMIQSANPAPQMPARQRPFSQQYFVLYPRAPLPAPQQFLAVPIAVTQQQLPTEANQPPAQQTSQQLSNFPFANQQQISIPYVPQVQSASQGIKTAPVAIQQVTKTSPTPQQTLNISPLQPQSAFSSVPNGAYYYGFQIKH